MEIHSKLERRKQIQSLLRLIPLVFVCLAWAALTQAHGAEVHSSLVLPEFKQPQLAVSPLGEIYLAAVSGSSIYFLRSSDGGHTFGKKTKVCEIGTKVGRRRGPRIALSGKAIVITFDSSDVFAVRSIDGGSTWSTPVRINSRKNCAQEGLHGMDGSSNGSVFVVWLDTLAGQTEVWGSLSTDGGRTWNKEQKIYASPDGHVCECCHPSVTFGHDGSLTVMWRNWLDGNRDMYMSTSKPAGSSFGPAKKLGNGSWRLDGCPMDGGAIISCGTQLLSAWQSKGTVFLANDHGAIEELGKGTQPVIACSANKTAVIYQSEGGLKLRRNGAASTLLDKRGNFPVMRLIPKTNKLCAAWELDDDEGQRVKVSIIDLEKTKSQ